MINNSHIFYNSYNLVVRRAQRGPVQFIFLKKSLFSDLVCVGGGVGGGGGVGSFYMKQMMQKTLMLILFDETSLIAIRTPQPILASNHSA